MDREAWQMPTSGGKMYARVRRDLRRQIVSGRLQPGARLGTEKELAARYGVSVLTVRQAQQALVSEGLIRKEQGRGTFVADLARRHRRVLLVCGLAHPHDHRSAGDLASPYYLNSIRFCREIAAERGLAMETAWMENHPAEHPSADRDTFAYDQISGYVFLGCTNDHPVLRRALAEGAHHVNLGKTYAGERTIWFDPQEAARIAWASLRDEVLGRRLPLVAVSMAGTEHGVEELARLAPGPIQHLCVPNSLNSWDFERRSYQFVRQLCAGGGGPMAFVFLDDVLARGGTRALLEAGLGGGQCPLAVACGRQEMFPYGLPATYVVHDTESEARWAVEMLAAQIEGEAGGTAGRRSPFALAAEDEHLHDDEAELSESVLVEMN